MSPRTLRALVPAALVLGLTACGAASPQGQPAPPGAPPPSSTSSTPMAAPSPTPGDAATPPAPATPTAAPTPTAAVSPAPSPTRDPGDPAGWQDWTLTTAGWGPVRTGQSIPVGLRLAFKPGWECIGPKFTRDGKELVQIFTADNQLGSPVTLISLENITSRTASGVRVGDSVDKLRQTYPRLATRPAYTAPQPGQRREVLELVDGQYSLFFEVDRAVRHISVQRAASFVPMGTTGICGTP